MSEAAIKGINEVVAITGYSKDIVIAAALRHFANQDKNLKVFLVTDFLYRGLDGEVAPKRKKGFISVLQACFSKTIGRLFRRSN